MRKTGKRGQGLVEYVLIVSLVALVCILSVTQIGTTVVGYFHGNVETIETSVVDASVSGS